MKSHDTYQTYLLPAMVGVLGMDDLVDVLSQPRGLKFGNACRFGRIDDGMDKVLDGRSVATRHQVFVIHHKGLIDALSLAHGLGGAPKLIVVHYVLGVRFVEGAHTVAGSETALLDFELYPKEVIHKVGQSNDEGALPIPDGDGTKQAIPMKQRKNTEPSQNGNDALGFFDDGPKAMQVFFHNAFFTTKITKS